MKSYTDLNQSKKLAEFLPFKSADMTLPFRHTLKNEYIPGHVVSRNYIDVYNEILALPGMNKEEVCKLIQPAWSLVALLEYMNRNFYNISLSYCGSEYTISFDDNEIYKTITKDYSIDAAFEMIVWLKETNRI